MEKHLLVTISDDPRMFHGLGFLTRFFSAFSASASSATFWPAILNSVTPSHNVTNAHVWVM